jgi:glucose/arabinose dehydrogenase
MRYPLMLATLAAATAAALALPLNAQTKTVRSKAGSISLETVAGSLRHPWGIAFLPDGQLLVTERPGRLRQIGKDGSVSEPFAGVPEVVARGQGGLLDVALDPDFSSNRMIYLSFAEEGRGGASTALGRGQLAERRVEKFEVIFRQAPKTSGGNHFGGRIAFAADGKLFLTLGERFKFEPSQDLSNHLGAVVRLNRDGSIPNDNPFAGQKDARHEIWSYGHRNIEAAAIHPETGKLWIAEMGPRGGDELNILEAGRNYGWPVVSWGQHYNGRNIPDPPTRPEFADAVRHWTPVISPSGMAFYTGEMFANWRGSVLIGGLSSQGIVRLQLDGEKIAEEERISLGARIRDVAQASDGSVYVITDENNGKVWRLTPSD